MKSLIDGLGVSNQTDEPFSKISIIRQRPKGRAITGTKMVILQKNLHLILAVDIPIILRPKKERKKCQPNLRAIDNTNVILI